MHGNNPSFPLWRVVSDFCVFKPQKHRHRVNKRHFRCFYPQASLCCPRFVHRWPKKVSLCSWWIKLKVYFNQTRVAPQTKMVLLSFILFLFESNVIMMSKWHIFWMKPGDLDENDSGWCRGRGNKNQDEDKMIDCKRRCGSHCFFCELTNHSRLGFKEAGAKTKRLDGLRKLMFEPENERKSPLKRPQQTTISSVDRMDGGQRATMNLQFNQTSEETRISQLTCFFTAAAHSRSGVDVSVRVFVAAGL